MNDLIGSVAGVLTTVAFLPQLLKIHASKSGRDVSARTFLIFSIGVVLWLLYGVRIRSAPVVFREPGHAGSLRRHPRTEVSLQPPGAARRAERRCRLRQEDSLT